MDAEALRVVTGQLDSSAEAQRRTLSVEPWDLYRWGYALTQLTDRLDAATSVVAGALGELGRETELRDDACGDPQARLDEARRQLEELRTALTSANSSARKFHSSVGHIGRAL